MINVVVCDDDSKFRLKIINNVKLFMENNEMEYAIYEFDDYNASFMKLVKEELSNVVYILDIETPTRSGIDAARIIRKYSDDSPIIFLTGHEELGNVILNRDLYFLSFINKFDNSTYRLNKALKMAMKLLNKKYMLRFSDRGSVYSLNIDKILYITTDTVARRTIIVTDNGEHRVNNPLSFFLDNLNGVFCQSHKSCIVNKSRISNINNNNNTIIFDNGISIDLLSDKYKKEIDLNA